MAEPRLFLALWPTDEVIDALCALPRKDQPGVRFIDPERWHVTLRFLGPSSPAAACAAMEDCALEASTVRLGPIVELLGDHSVVIPADGVDELAHHIAAATNHLGEPPRRRFHGHLTIARLGSAVRRGRRPLPKVVGMPFEAAWPATQVALVQSHRRSDGVRYETLATWPTIPDR